MLMQLIKEWAGDISVKSVSTQLYRNNDKPEKN